MSSLLTNSRQVSSDGGYYIPLASLMGKIYAYNPTAGVSTFSTAQWAAVGGSSNYLPLISSVGAGVLRDMGKTVVSASRTFRKVQLNVPSVSTFGVAGAAATTSSEDYLTGYIELGFNGTGTAAPVAHFGR